MVLEVHLKGGLDTLAAYADGSIRYINYSGSLVVSERADAEIRGLIDTLLRAGQDVPQIS